MLGESEVITSAPHSAPEQLNSRDSGEPNAQLHSDQGPVNLEEDGGGSWRRGREAALAGEEEGLLANSLGMEEQQGLGGVHKPGLVCTWHPVPGAQGRMGGGTRMLEVSRGQMVEISHAEGENLNFILTAPGSHGGIKPKKNTVGFGTKVFRRDMGKNGCGEFLVGAGKWLCG